MNDYKNLLISETLTSKPFAQIGQPRQYCAYVSDWPNSINNWVYIFPSVFDLCDSVFDDVLYSEGYKTKNLRMCFSMREQLLFSISNCCFF